MTDSIICLFFLVDFLSGDVKFFLLICFLLLNWDLLILFSFVVRVGSFSIVFLRFPSYLGCSFPLNCKYLHLSAYFFYEFAVSLCVFRYQSSC